MNQPHKHKDMIIAWANGEQIEFRIPSETDEWKYVSMPFWLEDVEYRVKPEPKERVHSFRIGVGAYDDGSIYTFTVDNEVEEQHLQAGLNFIGWISDWESILLIKVEE